jgi:tellurite resistance protein TehA-like permease
LIQINVERIASALSFHLVRRRAHQSRKEMNESSHTPLPQPAGRRGSEGVRRVAATVGRGIAGLDPGYFALVMATGIISNVFFLQGQRTLSNALFALNLAIYGCLWLLTIVRAARFTAPLRADLTSPQRVFLFFTTVAANDVLGMSLALRGCSSAALVLWLVACALWLGLTYLGFAVYLFRNAGGTDVIGGAWLNAIVGTQSLAILGGAAALPAVHAAPQAFVLLPALWAVGLGLYAILIVLLANRMFFAPVTPESVEPLLWVVMGAAAISVNAGVVVASDAAVTPFLQSLRPFFAAVTLAVWAWATWWIPLLVLIGVWKHGLHRLSIRYTPMLWSMVFPLGMYAAATLRLSRLADVPALITWSQTMAWIALAAWAATAAGLIAASASARRG